MKTYVSILIAIMFFTACSSDDRTSGPPVQYAPTLIQRNLIVTADDYGAVACVDRGVDAGVEVGFVTAVSALVNFPNARDRIVTLHENHPELGIGVHLNITTGRPLSPSGSVPTLVHESGRFLTLQELLPLIDKVDLVELKREMRRQIMALSEWGVPVDHLSSQHNILHLYTPFFRIVTDLAEEYHLPVRSPVVLSVAYPLFRDSAMNRFARENLRKVVWRHPFAIAPLRKYTRIEEMEHNHLDMISRGIRSPDILADSLFHDATPENLRFILDNLPAGTTELVVHLGIGTDGVEDTYGMETWYFPYRELELFCLSSIQFHRWLEERQISLIGFDKLPAPAVP